MPGYLRNRGWTPVDVAIWLVALLVVIIIQTLSVIGVIGSWGLLAGSGVAMAVGFWRYRAETEQNMRNAGRSGRRGGTVRGCRVKVLGLILIAAFVGVCCLVGAEAIGAVPRPIPHLGKQPPQREVSEEWVRYVDIGDQRAACELQTVPEVNGLACGSLPPVFSYSCPMAPVGAVAKKSPPRASELRRVYEQVGALTEEGADRAYVVLNGQKMGSRWRGALGLERVGDTWRVSYLRQGTDTFAPAGAVWMTDAWRRLWYPPGCPGR